MKGTLYMKDFINKITENKKVLVMIIIAVIVIIIFNILHGLLYNKNQEVVFSNETTCFRAKNKLFQA